LAGFEGNWQVGKSLELQVELTQCRTFRKPLPSRISEVSGRFAPSTSCAPTLLPFTFLLFVYSALFPSSILTSLPQTLTSFVSLWRACHIQHRCTLQLLHQNSQSHLANISHAQPRMERYSVFVSDCSSPEALKLLVPFQSSARPATLIDEIVKRASRFGHNLNAADCVLHLETADGLILDPDDVLSDLVFGEHICAVFTDKATQVSQLALFSYVRLSNITLDQRPGVLRRR